MHFKSGNLINVMKKHLHLSLFVLLLSVFGCLCLPAQVLKQSTAVTVQIGPAVAASDGNTEVADLTITEIEISKAGGTFAAPNGSATLTLDDDGFYKLALTTSDTDTLGLLVVKVVDGTAMTFGDRFQVIAANAYDGIYGSGDYLQVDTVQVEGSDATDQLDARIAAYDGPTNAEMEARTLVAASYATASAQATAQSDLDTLTGTDGATLATSQPNYAPATASGLATAQADLDLLTGTDGATLATSQPNYAPSTATAMATAQADLDTLTGSDGVTLATAQANYAPAVAGDAMTLADDAITSAKFDETTAFPLAQADSSSTAVARVGADGDTLETLSDQIDGISSGSSPSLLQTTTIATLASQTSFTLTAGSADDDAYNDAMAILVDQATSTQKAVAKISDYTGSTKTITLAAAPAFTIATGDTVNVVAVPRQLDADISGVGGTVGPGAYEHTHTVLVSGVPVEGFALWVTTDTAGSNVIAGTLYTNASGQATFLLDAGTYYMWGQLSGYSPIQGESFTVSAP